MWTLQQRVCLCRLAVGGQTKRESSAKLTTETVSNIPY